MWTKHMTVSWRAVAARGQVGLESVEFMREKTLCDFTLFSRILYGRDDISKES